MSRLKKPEKKGNFKNKTVFFILYTLLSDRFIVLERCHTKKIRDGLPTRVYFLKEPEKGAGLSSLLFQFRFLSFHFSFVGRFYFFCSIQLYPVFCFFKLGVHWCIDHDCHQPPRAICDRPRKMSADQDSSLKEPIQWQVESIENCVDIKCSKSSFKKTNKKR